MKEIRESMNKKFSQERDESEKTYNLQIFEEEKTKTEQEVNRMMSSLVKDGMHKSLRDRQAPSFVSNLKMQQTLNFSKTYDEYGQTVEDVGEKVTELEELCDFTEVEIGEFDETQAAKQLQQQRQNKPEKMDRSVLLTPGNKTVAIKNVMDRLSNMQQQLAKMDDML